MHPSQCLIYHHPLQGKHVCKKHLIPVLPEGFCCGKKPFQARSCRGLMPPLTAWQEGFLLVLLRKREGLQYLGWPDWRSGAFSPSQLVFLSCSSHPSQPGRRTCAGGPEDGGGGQKPAWQGLGLGPGCLGVMDGLPFLSFLSLCLGRGWTSGSTPSRWSRSCSRSKTPPSRTVSTARLGRRSRPWGLPFPLRAAGAGGASGSQAKPPPCICCCP